jgi:hypothetical protein
LHIPVKSFSKSVCDLCLGKIWHFYVDNFCVPTIKYIICIIFKIIVFFIITLFARLYVIVGILLTIGKHLMTK